MVSLEEGFSSGTIWEVQGSPPPTLLTSTLIVPYNPPNHKTRGSGAKSLTWENSSNKKREKSIIYFKLESPSPKDVLCQIWLKLAQCLENILNFVIVFLLFHNYLPFEKGGPLHLNKVYFSSPKDALIVQSLVDIGPVVLEKIIFKFCHRKFFKFVNAFSLFHNYLPLEKGRTLH